MGEPRQRTAKEYEDLGRQFVAVYDSLNPNRKAVYRTSLVKGLISGLGGVVGATVGIAILLWVLSLFDQIPFIGHFVDAIKHTLQNH
jgi:hypothetical protein